MALFELEDVIFEKIKTPNGYEAAYKLMIKQPLDHNDPEAGHFYQKVYLSHMGFDAPAVMVAEGYSRPANWIYEFSDYMDANQIQIEHRFFGESYPDEIDYQYLNLRQVTADMHKIKTLFAKLYQGPWLCTGISKGGMTTLFYRYFYPEDVDVSVPYVAPINLAFKDKRIYKFLDTVGTDDCRKAVLDYQKRLLKNKKEYMPLIKWYAKGKGLSFERLGFEAAYEYSVLEYSFSFWQSGIKCESIPSKEASTDEALDHFIEVIGIDFFGDKILNGFASFYFQMGTEMGYYGYETNEFKGLIDALDKEPSAVFMPDNTTPDFDDQLTKKAHNYFTKKLEQVIYINGDSDTWSATAVRPKASLDAVAFFLEKQSHYTARIQYMTEKERKKLETTLERWLNIDVAATLGE